MRGLQPWPSAYTFFKGRRLVVWRAEPLKPGGVEDASREFETGAVVEAQGDRLVVGCGGGTALKLGEVQLEGKQRTSARDFVNGTRVVAGERLG